MVCFLSKFRVKLCNKLLLYREKHLKKLIWISQMVYYIYIILDLMDEMEDMKYETEYMNEMMNRNYNCDVDEDELDREMQEIEQDM